MSHDKMERRQEIFNKLMQEEHDAVHRQFIGDGGVVTEMSILRMIAHASATLDFIFVYTTEYFDTIQESKQQDGFQVGEASNGFEASNGGL